MAFQIPKLQYKNTTNVGTTTSGSGVISGISDTSDIEVGMSISGTGIPANSTVESVTSYTITLASGVLCTSSNTSIDLTLNFEISFDFPPKEPRGEKFETKATVTAALSGIQQVAVSHIEATRKLLFSFLSPTIFASLETFMQTHALNGESFRYFDDKTLTTYVEYELDKLGYDPRKIAPRSETTWSWEIQLEFRRVL